MASAADPALGRRVLSALVLAPLVLAITWQGGWPFGLLVAATTALVAYEWHGLAAARGGRASGAYAGLVALAAALAALVLTELERPGLALVVLALACLFAGLGARLLALGLGWAALGVLYLGLPAIALVWLREAPPGGLVALLWLLAVVWTTDSAAYLVGRRLGGPRLAPAISPGKTWSGLVGGMLGAALVGALVGGLVGSGRLLQAGGIGAALAAVSQAGDLLESHLKRIAGVKDAGALIPGHGGVLDRVDGLLAAAPALALWLLLAGEGGAPWL